MNLFAQNDPLTDGDLDLLADFLKTRRTQQSMNVERLDEFCDFPGVLNLQLAGNA